MVFLSCRNSPLCYRISDDFRLKYRESLEGTNTATVRAGGIVFLSIGFLAKTIKIQLQHMLRLWRDLRDEIFS
jgi:hypothetical protein